MTGSSRSRVSWLVLVGFTVGAGLTGALAADLLSLEEGGVVHLRVRDTGSLHIGDGSAPAGIVLDDTTPGVSPTLTQAALGSVFGGAASDADAWHTHASAGGGGIKRVQHGSVDFTEAAEYRNIGITPVNWSKTFIVFHHISANEVRVVGHSSTYFRVQKPNSNGVWFSYEVIEFN